MTSHFKWYPSSEDAILSWHSRYQFPSQSNKAEKATPRIPPKSGGVFTAGNVVRLEFPAQGHVNPRNTTIEFDVAVKGYDTDPQCWRIQNNIQSIFQRVR